MRIIKNSIIPFGSYKAITLGPWVFCKCELKEEDVNHEAIHWEQQKELLIVFFFLLYVLMYFYEVVRCLFDCNRGYDKRKKNSLHERAYRSIAFEREAYKNEKDSYYLTIRTHYNWMISG